MSTIDITKYNLRNDIIFKYVFATENSEDILIDLLNAVFLDSGQEQIAEITYLNPMNLKKYLLDKATVIDIKARDSNGRLYNIDIMVRSGQNFIESILFHNSKLMAGQKVASLGFENLYKTISIVFTDAVMFQEEKNIHNVFRFLNSKSHKELNDMVEYHIVELPKYKDTKRYDTPLKRWLYALVNGELLMDNPEMIPEAIKKQATIMKTINKMQKATSDKDVRAILEYLEKAVRDEAGTLP